MSRNGLFFGHLDWDKISVVLLVNWEVSVFSTYLLKSSRNKDLNDVTAAPFSVGFFAAGSWEKDTENRVAVTSLRSFLFHDDFIDMMIKAVEKLGKYIIIAAFD